MRVTSREDTIYALASAPGTGGISVFRVSGPKAFDCLEALTGLRQIIPRKAVACSFRDPVEKVWVGRQKRSDHLAGC